MQRDPRRDALRDDDGPEGPDRTLELFRVTDRLGELGAQDPESEVFLTEVVAEIARRTSSPHAVLSLIDADTGLLETRAKFGFGVEAPDGLSVIGEGIHGWVVKIGTSMIISNPDQSAARPLLPFERTGLLAAPIQVGGDRLGALSVLRPRSAAPYGEEDMLFLATVGSLLGGMVGHGRAATAGQEAVRKAIESLTMALEARDPYTRGHSQRVAMYSLAVANELESATAYSFVKELRNSLLMSALLHDIGKIGIRDEVLLKPGKLTDEEYALIKTHPEKGAEIVRMIPGFDENVIAGILQHHERWDGQGYPGGLAGEQIHLFGRIIGLADCFDAIVTSRPYSSAASFGHAMQRVEELAGTAFDPEVVRAMLRALKDQNVWVELGQISRSRPDSEPNRFAKERDSVERTLRRVFGRNVNDLPTLPHVVTQVLEKTRDANANLDDIVNLISTDQALVTTYLKLVNSAFYGFNRRIATLKQAITLLGFRSVRNVVVNAGVVGIFRKRMFNNRYRHKLWNHSVACAVSARVIAERTGYKAKEEAFTAGLLHDIGKIVIDQYAPKESARIMELIEGGIEARAAEMQILSIDHTRIGSWIAERWQLPKSLCEVIEHHHEPEADAAAGHRDLVRVVAVANTLCGLRSSDAPERLCQEVEAFVASPANVLKFTAPETMAVLEEMWQVKSAAMKTFGPGMAGETVGEIERAEAEKAAE
jgi:putative nucleotidyltransferase with HDIG domain